MNLYAKFIYAVVFSLLFLSNVLLLEVITLSQRQTTPLTPWISKKKVLAFPFYSTFSIFCLHLFSELKTEDGQREKT